MDAGRILRLVIVSVAAVLTVAACESGPDDDPPEPTPTSTPDAQAGANVAGLPEIGEAPCEVVEPEPPRDDAPEPDPERIEEWLETAMSFNDVASGPDGERYIGSYRHAAVLVVDADGSLHDVWTDGVRNTHPQIVTHPDDRIILLQDNGIHFHEPDGTHQKYLSMFDGDAGWFPEYGGLGIDSQGHLYVGVGHEQQVLKLDEECNVLAQWPAGDVHPLIAVDGDDLVYSMIPSPETSEVRVRDQDGNELHAWGIDPPDENALPYAITDRPEGGIAIVWNVPAEERIVDPRERAVADFLVHLHEADGELVAEWAGSDSGAEELLAQPSGMTIESDGTIHIVDGGVGEGQMRMHSFSADGRFLDEWRLEHDEALCDYNDSAAWIVDC